MKDYLLRETLNLYSKINSIYNCTGYRESYKLNAFWADQNMKDMLKILNTSASAKEAIRSAQKTWMFSVNTADPVREKAVDWLLDNQKKEGLDIFDMDASIEDSHFSNPKNNARRKGRILTPDFLRTVSIAFDIKKYCPTGKSKFRIIELGAGCGHLARTLKLFMPDCCYVIIDIPESLCFSYMFLKLNFPNARILYITDENQFKNFMTNKFDYIFIPTKFAEDILGENFDLFINTASMGEMKNSIIRYWMDFIQSKLKVKYLFTLNRYLNTIKTDGSLDWRLDENECSVLYDSHWKILNWELEPSFTRCPYVDTIISRYLEIVAERGPFLSIVEREKRNRDLLSKVMDEDWIRLEKSFPPEMTYRDNVLVNDMTMNGSLFKLWESVRLYPNEVNVGLMLKYLESLMHRQDREFEETFYYENLFDDSFVSKDRKELLEVHNVIKEKQRYRKSQLQAPPGFASPISLASLLPRLVEEDCQGFNIVKYGSNFYAFAQDLGNIDLTDPNVGDVLKEFQEQSRCFVGGSAFEVKHLVDKFYSDTLKVHLSDKDKTIEALRKNVSRKDEL